MEIAIFVLAHPYRRQLRRSCSSWSSFASFVWTRLFRSILCLSTLSFLCMPQHNFECVSEQVSFFTNISRSLSEEKKRKHETHFPIQNIRGENRYTFYVICDRTKLENFSLFSGSGVCVLWRLCESRSSLCLFAITLTKGTYGFLSTLFEGGKKSFLPFACSPSNSRFALARLFYGVRFRLTR